jgi:hypothetical protein
LFDFIFAPEHLIYGIFSCDMSSFETGDTTRTNSSDGGPNGIVWEKSSQMDHEKRPKKIIVCCDGTWQGETFAKPSTNVLRITRCITPSDGEGTPQVVYYQPGVGTGTSRLANLVDGCIGRGEMQLLK